MGGSCECDTIFIQRYIPYYKFLTDPNIYVNWPYRLDPFLNRWCLRFGGKKGQLLMALYAPFCDITIYSFFMTPNQ